MPRKRILVLTGLIVAGLLAGLTFATIPVGGLAVLGVALLDLLLIRLARSPRVADLDLDLSIRSEAVGGGVTPGVTVALEATVRCGASGRMRVEVVPLLPSGVRPLGPAGAWLRLGRGEKGTVTLRYRIERVGIVVFPGVLIRRWSWLRFFRRAILLVDRTEVHALPNYAGSDHPIVSRFLRGDAPASERSRGRAIRGQGTDFSELRVYQPPDPMRRVDWKATARRGRLLVREYEEPPEYTIRVILDGSSDLTEGEAGPEAFAHAADLVGKLAYVASLREMTMALTVYDRSIVFARKTAGRGPSFLRLLAELVRVPWLARRRRLASRTEEVVRELARRSHRAVVARWRAAEDLEGFLRAYQGVEAGEFGDPAAYLMEFDAGFADLTVERCPGCGEPRFSDEPGCPGCGESWAPGALPERAACLAGVLTKALRESRGREMLIVISAFRGGEASPAMAGLLRLAATGYRKVHVVLPTHRALLDDRAEMPRSMGMYPSKTRTLRDIDTLESAETMREFLDQIRAVGVATHPIEDAAELEDLLAKLLVSEVLAQ